MINLSYFLPVSYNPCEMILSENTDNISSFLKYHIQKKIPLCENIFRIYSDSYFELINEVRELYFENKISLCDEDAFLVESDIGKKALFEGREVYLDAPIPEYDDLLLEAEYRGRKVKLNKPFRTPNGPKKFAVYVKSKKGNVKKVTFGDPKRKVKNYSKGRAKSFQARHKCNTKKDRTKAGYWSCNIHRYRKALGLKSSNKW